jgi:SAM-dependent methyltransferase
MTVWDYSGVVAQAYDSFFGTEPFFDQALFTRRVTENCGPALELACGTGRLLLPLLRDGLEVDGLDTSGDMLAILQRKAAALGLTPELHQRLMQDFDLPDRFATVFCAVNSFQILVDDAEIIAALACCHRALLPGGELILTVAARPDAWATDWRERRRVTLADGAAVIIFDQTSPHPTLPRWRWDLRWHITRQTASGPSTEQLLQSFELRDYEATDLHEYLDAAGFEGIREQRGYTGLDLAASSGEQTSEQTGQRIVFARRPQN